MAVDPFGGLWVGSGGVGTAVGVNTGTRTGTGTGTEMYLLQQFTRRRNSRHSNRSRLSMKVGPAPLIVMFFEDQVKVIDTVVLLWLDKWIPFDQGR